MAKFRTFSPAILLAVEGSSTQGSPSASFTETNKQPRSEQPMSNLLPYPTALFR